MDLTEQSHRRFNPLTGESILVSPHRTKRPWQGKVEALPSAQRPQYDPKCYLCPGNDRAEGAKNPDYEGTFVFQNDFAALLETGEAGDFNEEGLLVAQAERGLCKVVCFSPRHDLTMARMSQKDVIRVIETWTKEYKDLGAMPNINYVQIFENRGEIMGCSNPHPHGQIWANEHIPDLPEKEGINQKLWKEKKGSCLLCDYTALELKKKDRIVCENDRFVVLVPFWAIWPFETMVLPKKHLGNLCDFDNEDKAALADILGRITRRYDNLFQVSFPYSMGLHQTPTDNKDHEEWHFHIHFLPPLLRSATVKKFMVGYELLAQPQRDITPEAGAQRLRDCSEEIFQ